MLNILVFIAGFAILILGANMLVEGASSLAKRYNIPNIVIGLTIVAFGTSSPELVVNIFASLNKNPDISLGNVVGSNIFNVLGILGVASLIYPLSVKSNTTWIEIPLALLSAFVVLITANDMILDNEWASVISRSDGIIFLCFFLIFMVYNFTLMKTSSETDDVKVKDYSRLKASLFVVLGLLLLVGGGKLIVSSATALALMAGISERVIALTIVSIGTSFPELATSIVAALKKNVDIAIGNVVGSNIFNSFFILGVSAIIYPVSAPPKGNIDLLVNVFISLLLFAVLFTGSRKKIDRWEGALFLVCYAGYVGWLLWE